MAVARSVAVTLAVALLLTLPGLALAVDPIPSPSPAPTAEPTPTPTATAEPTPTPTPTPAPTSAPTATPTPAPTGPTVLGATVTFHGRGYGHGVGMSQYGARGRALDGQTAAAILAHYYRGTEPGTVDPATRIRVRVLKSFAASNTKPLVLYARRGTWTINGVAGTFPKDARLTVTPRTTTVDGVTRTTWKLRITDAAGTLLRRAATTSFRIRGTTDTTVFQVWSRPSNYDTYRGVIRSMLDARKPIANVVNEVGIDTYLRGVVPAEMPSSWPTEALKAQSIAARSYAARRLRPGVSWYDVSDDTSSQVYLGLEGERPATDAAIAATAGVVLRSGTAIANTMFHSAGGGATEHNENVYVSSTGARVAGPVSYLRGSRDRRLDGTAYDSASPYATWKTLTYTRSQLSAWFGADARTNVGSLTALDLRRRGVSGRLISVTLIGSLGSKTVSGDVFRSIFNARRPSGDPMLRSTLFDLKPVP